MLDLDNRRTHTRIGMIYALLSLPGWVALATGRLFEARNLYLLLSLMGLPLGGMFLVFGRGLRRLNSRAGYAARIGILGIAFAAFMLLAYAGVRMGAQPLMTAVMFCAMAASYLSLLAFIFVAAALFQRDGAGGTAS